MEKYSITIEFSCPNALTGYLMLDALASKKIFVMLSRLWLLRGWGSLGEFVKRIKFCGKSFQIC